MMTGLTVVVLVLHVLAVNGIFSGDMLTPEQLQKLDEYIETVMSCRKVPGLTLAVVQGDKVLQRSYGKTDLDKNTNVTEDSIFCIGSLTKAMTTTLLSKLLHSKFPQSVWDTKLKDILGESFELYDDYVTKEATLKDILSHRMGFARGDMGWVAGYPDSLSRAQMTKRLHLLPVAHPFRYTFEYNNWMYFLAGHVAEIISGEEALWEDLMNEHLFQPLSMNSTMYSRDLKEQPEGRVARPYLPIDGDYLQVSFDSFRTHPIEPGAGVCSTSKDMVLWLQFLLQVGSAPPLDDIVNANALRATMEPYQLMYYPGGNWYKPTFPVSDVQFGYGLGWISASYRGRRQVVHSGEVSTHRSYIYLYPELKTGIFLSNNGQQTGLLDPKIMINYYLSDLLFGEEPWLNSSTACTFPAPWVNFPEINFTKTHPVFQSQRALDEYTGIYGSQFYGDMHVSVNDSGFLQMKLGTSLHSFLFPTEQKDIFYWKVAERVWFSPLTSLNDKFHFYISNEGKELNALNVTIVGQFLQFDRNIRFNETSSGTVWYQGYFMFIFVLTSLDHAIR